MYMYMYVNTMHKSYFQSIPVGICSTIRWLFLR